jgi:MFS transporter, DHA3 family, tetracycline resistance protein
VGFTFQSGANDAWLADEVGPEHAAPIFIRGTQISQIMAQVGILGAIVIGQAGLPIPLIVAGVGMIGMGLILVRAMTETGFQPERVSASVLAQMQQTFQKSLILVRTNRRFVSVVLVGFVVGLSVGGYDRLFTPHFVQNFQLPLEPIVWLGLLSAVVSFSSALVLQWMRGRAKLMSAERIPGAIAWLYAGTILGNVAFVLAGRFEMAVFAYWFSQMLRATTRPLIIVWINQIAESRVRATAISMYWQSNALGHIVGMPVIGLIGSLTSMRVALMTSVLSHSPVLWLLTRRRASVDPARDAGM